MNDYEHGQESAHQRANKKGKARRSLRQGKVNKKARQLGAKLGAFIDFLASARKEVLDRESGAWAHEQRQDLTQEQYQERLALQDTARLLLDTRYKVLSLANKAHENYKRTDDQDPDRAEENTRLINLETNRTYEAMHSQSKVRLIPTYDKKKAASRSKAVTTFWNVAMVTLMMAHGASSAYEAGLRGRYQFRELAAYSEQTSFAAPRAASAQVPFQTDKERADDLKKANDGVKSWVSMKRKAMGKTNINSPFVVFVPMRSTEAGNLVRQQFEAMDLVRELKIGKEHVPYA